MATGFWMNNKNCFGCKTCSIACKGEKQLGEGVLLRTVSTFIQDDPAIVSYVSMACNHCEEPACMATCPVGAYTKDEATGLVIQDHELCIGCKTCITACPWGAPSFDEASSTTFKCDGCVDRQAAGMAPACVAFCPGANIECGDMADLQAKDANAVVGNTACGTSPNFVITVDPKLNDDPSSLVLAAKGNM